MRTIVMSLALLGLFTVSAAVQLHVQAVDHVLAQQASMAADDSQ